MLRTTPVFGDPKTDFVFQRIFGSDDHKTALLGFLNDILQLDDAHRLSSVMLLPPEQRPRVSELKYSIVDVKCVDARGTTYVVEMQVLNVEAFEKRVVYNVAKAYTNQLSASFTYPELDDVMGVALLEQQMSLNPGLRAAAGRGSGSPKAAWGPGRGRIATAPEELHPDVIGISICDFELWPRNGQSGGVPMLSRWRMQEQASGVVGLPELQLVFLELPKYTGGDEPRSLVDKWAYFFREAGNLLAIPDALRHPPLLEALEAARTARFTREEWDAYIAAGMAIQNERGALSLARKEGHSERGAGDVLTVLRVRGIVVPEAARARILAEKDPELLERWLERAVVAASVDEVIGERA